ncbi:MAG: phenylalanine--tRNA ligase subunit beta [Epsilonproteobacteria bacterium]|nr:phenylalanine--tRNA ligase subunit beta [Campylobacterota bacterium]
MIVTREWLKEFIDIENISDKELYETFNKIGLEVDSYKKYEIPPKVVVGKVLECKKHPNADKLNVCQVDIGKEVKQIVCGASNVWDATYVPVALVGAKLGDNFEIKEAKLRGVESHGMICSSTEINLPKMEDGIMILDDSIGTLEVGKELRDYPLLNDSIFELELTANRGDCLSIRGVARDLAAAFNIELKHLEYTPKRFSKIGIARLLNIESKNINGFLEYLLVKRDSKFYTPALWRLRLAFAEIESEGFIDSLTKYSTHATGVILRAYDLEPLKKEDRASLYIKEKDRCLIEVSSSNRLLSIVGVNMDKEAMAKDSSEEILIEASYVDPDCLIDAISKYPDIRRDEIYYKTSRGSESDLNIGLDYLKSQIDKYSDVEFFQTPIKVGKAPKDHLISIKTQELFEIIGEEIPLSKVHTILKRLGFKLSGSSNAKAFGVIVPPFRHDIKNIHDIAEEVLRIIGIDNIEAKPLHLIEKNRFNKEAKRYRAIRDIRQRGVSAGFFEALTYAFAQKELLEKYNFETLEEELELINPIVEELNTLRTTILINLLEAAKRNINYGKKRVSLFEIGSVFNAKREESQKIAFVWVGEYKRGSFLTAGKSQMIDFDKFYDAIARVIGDFELKRGEIKNLLAHPYQSAIAIKDNKEIGFISKLHLKAANDFELPSDAFIAEFNLDDILPKEKFAKEISNFQSVTKDLSILIDKDIEFYEIMKSLRSLKEKMDILKDYYPLDLYISDDFGDKKSLTLRFTLQSMDKTLSDEDIEMAMGEILKFLEENFKATLR